MARFYAKVMAVLTLALAVAMLAGLVLAAPAPALNPNARRDYRIRILDPDDREDPNNRRMWIVTEFSLWTEDGSYEGKPAKVLKREDRSSQGDRILWEFTVAPDLKPYISSRKVYSRQNKLLEENVEYTANHFYRFPPRTIHAMMTPWALEHIDLAIGRRSDYWITLGSENEPWQMFFTPEGDETVTVPAGSFRCVRVRVEYSLDKLPGFFKVLPRFIVKQIASGYTAWVMKAPPHFMIKFQGKLDGLGSPEKAQELVRIR